LAEASVNTTRTAGGEVVVVVRGEVDAASSGRLRQTLVDVAGHERPVRLVVDMGHVTFIDSTGLGALAAGRNAALGVGSGFVVRNPSPFVAHQLRVVGMYDQVAG
jgi:anti-anti-sigma factor